MVVLLICEYAEIYMILLLIKFYNPCGIMEWSRIFDFEILNR
jgi:hypothetical protein